MKLEASRRRRVHGAEVSDYAAFERQARRRLAEVIANDGGPLPYPEPVEHCAICRWRPRCADRRRDDDDLSLVAGMTRGSGAG